MNPTFGCGSPYHDVKIKVVFFGSSNYTHQVLMGILGYPRLFSVEAILTQPSLRQNPNHLLRQLAEDHKIPLFYPTQLDLDQLDQTIIQALTRSQLALVVDYGLKVPLDMLALPRYGFFNIHPSLLPAYRGVSPVQQAILDGVKKVGVTLYQLNEKFDQGPILAQTLVTVGHQDTAFSLYQKLYQEGVKLAVRCLPLYVIGKIKLKPQPLRSPTPVTKRVSREHGRIDWQRKAICLERMVRAYYPWPGAYTFLRELANYADKVAKTKKKLRVKILKAHLDKKGQLRLDKLQVEGKKPLTWPEFVRGYLG